MRSYLLLMNGNPDRHGAGHQDPGSGLYKVGQNLVAN